MGLDSAGVAPNDRRATRKGVTTMMRIVPLGLLPSLKVEEILYPRSLELFGREERLAAWSKEFPGDFDLQISGMSGNNPAQEIAMYVLRKEAGIRSLTWFKLGMEPSETKGQSTSPADLEARQGIITKVIGQDLTSRLKVALREAKLRNFKGEPDLFCWKPDLSDWFFAEVKKDDGLHSAQIRWHLAAKSVIEDDTRFRLLLLTPTDE